MLLHTPDSSIQLFAEKHYPEHLPLEELDIYLSLGWYRMGQSIFTTHFLCFGKKFYSALWIRLNLFNHTFRKSQRKLMRKNGESFDVKYAPFHLSKEKEQLYWRYKKNFKGFLAGSLEESLLDGEDFNIYNTYEVQIYDGNKLIGLSFFDIGRESASSIMGIYDPNYHSYSLGYYTMLMEMDYCLKLGLEYYYPGYVVPGYDRFDYKVRIGDVEVYEMNSWKWKPFNLKGEFVTPVQEMELKLLQLMQLLSHNKVDHHFYYYPLFEANLFGFWNTQYLDFPLFVQIFKNNSELEFFYFIIYDPRDALFKLLRCSNIENHSFFFNKSYINTFVPDKYFMVLSSVEATLVKTNTIDDINKFILEKEHVFI